MITSGIWWDFEFKLKQKWNSGYYYSDGYMAVILIITVLLTPVAIVLDILFLPFELMYYICSKIVERLRKKK